MSMTARKDGNFFNQSITIMKNLTNLIKLEEDLSLNLRDTVYLNFGVYTMNNGTKILFEAMTGPFASTAWIEGDAEYNEVLGQKFDAITGDDNKSYSLDRNKIRRLESIQEFMDLLNSENTCEAFRNQSIKWLTEE